MLQKRHARVSATRCFRGLIPEHNTNLGSCTMQCCVCLIDRKDNARCTDTGTPFCVSPSGRFFGTRESSRRPKDVLSSASNSMCLRNLGACADATCLCLHPHTLKRRRTIFFFV